MELEIQTLIQVPKIYQTFYYVILCFIQYYMYFDINFINYDTLYFGSHLTCIYE